MACRKTYRHAIRFLLELKTTLGTPDRLAHHLTYQGYPKSPSLIFFVLTHLDCFDLGTSLSEKYVLRQCGDVSYVGHWPRAIHLCDRQTDRLTDRQTGRQIYFAVLELADLITLTVDGLYPNCQETVLKMYVSSVSFPLKQENKQLHC